jgi:hypothetical protein
VRRKLGIHNDQSAFEKLAFQTFWCHHKNVAESEKSNFSPSDSFYFAVPKRVTYSKMLLLVIWAFFIILKFLMLMRIFRSVKNAECEKQR